jgi:glycosyltransferase involved in cell wall biosynthesis
MVQALSMWPWVEAVPDFSYSPCGLTSWPRISIVTPNYNYGHLIEMTLRSVLAQGYPNLEYIVIDDGSTDASMQVIEKYASRLAYVEHQANQGQYPTINKGFAKATGDICAWLNSDDIYLPWTLQTVARIFAQFPSIEWIVGRSSVMQEGVVHEIRPFRPFPRVMVRAGLFNDPSDTRFDFIQQESCFWRRSLWEKVGGLSTELRYAADFDLWPRFARHADLYAVSTVLGGFTMRANENRSRANRDRYMQEVQDTMSRLRMAPTSSEPRTPRGVVADNVRRWLRRRIGNTIAAKLFPVEDPRGPTLRWDFLESRYVLRHEALGWL